MFDRQWARAVLAAGGAFALAACTQPRVGVDAPGDPSQAVTAVVETIVTTDSAVDADDPELWADPRDPSRAVLFAADKSDGLYVHDLDGRVRQFLPDGRFPEGLLAMHDNQDAPHKGQQNFKLVDWRAVKKALGLPTSHSVR